MKLFIVLVGFLAAVSAGTVSSKVEVGARGIDDSLLALLECLREKMPEGIGESGPLDPLIIEFFELSLEGALTLDGYLQDVKVVGLSGFEINLVKFSLIGMKFDFDITFKEVKVEGRYDLDGTAGGFIPIFGKGPCLLEVGDVNLQGQILINTVDTHLNLKQMTLAIDLGRFYANIEGLLGGGDISILINRVINDLVPSLIANSGDLINELVDGLAKDLANPLLKDMQLTDLLEMINGDGGGLC